MLSAIAVITAKGPMTNGAADPGAGQITDTPATPVNTDGEDVLPGCDNENEEEEADPVTTISASKIACGFWEQTVLYTWTIDKTLFENDNLVLADDCNRYDLMIEPGESVMISYLIAADRSDPAVTDMMGVMGTITVTNTGCADTEGLTIVDTVQILTVNDCGAYVDYMSFNVDTSSHPVLAAGESYAYSYKFEFAPVEGACYRNVADVTICNYEGHDGEMYGVKAMDTFALPCEPDVTIIDDKACVVDEIGNIPKGFTVEALTGLGPWSVEDDFEVSVNLQVTNVNACRDKIVTVCNAAILTAQDSCVKMSDAVNVVIYTGYYETTLGIVKTADVSWTEYIQLGLSFPEAALASEISQEDVEFAETADPVVIDQIVLSDVGTFTVTGIISVMNNGCYATHGLAITDTIQIWYCDEWVDLASIDVDTCAKPVLCPGESFDYAYEIVFTLENVAAIDFCEVMLQNVAYASICNYDDDAGVDGVYFIVPLDVPFLPTMVTMETEVNYCTSTIAPLGDGCDAPTMEFATELYYHQLVTIVFGEETVISTMTEISVISTLTYTDRCDSVSHELNTGIYNEGTTKIIGDDKCGEIGFNTATMDDETMTICFNCHEVDVDMRAILVGCNLVQVCICDDGFAITNDQMMFYGAYACFVIPGDDLPPAQDL